MLSTIMTIISLIIIYHYGIFIHCIIFDTRIIFCITIDTLHYQSILI
jgi:hypothetical protein